MAFDKQGSYIEFKLGVKFRCHLKFQLHIDIVSLELRKTLLLVYWYNGTHQ